MANAENSAPNLSTDSRTKINRSVLVLVGNALYQFGPVVFFWPYSFDNNSTSILPHFNHLIELKLCCLYYRSGKSNSLPSRPCVKLISTQSRQRKTQRRKESD